MRPITRSLPKTALFCSTVLALLLPFAPLGHSQSADTAAVPQTKEEAEHQFHEADKELNGVYQRCLDPKTTGAESIEKLKEAQRKWIEYRDTNAAAYRNASTRHPVKDEFYLYAQTVITRSRTHELRQLFLGE